MAIDEIVGDSIDRAINVEMRFRVGLPRGVTYPLYEAARKKQKKPLTWLAAKLLMDSIKPGDNVFVITGAGTPPGLPAGETDGPPGAAAIARAIEFGLGGKPILISEERNMPAVIKSTEAAGLAVYDEALFKQRRSCAMAINFPLGDAAGKKAAAALIKKYKPAAMVFIEKVGPNTKGIYHSIMGTPRTPDKIASAYHLADQAKASPRLASATVATRSAAASSRKRWRRSSRSARTAAVPVMAALARLLNVMCWSSLRCRTGVPTASPRRWRVTWGTASFCTTKRRSCGSCRRVSTAARWTGPIPASSPTSTARRTRCRPR